jgi:peptidylprolyl isomerase
MIAVRRLAPLTAAAVALLAAGCGSSSKTSAPASTGAHSATTPATAAPAPKATTGEAPAVPNAQDLSSEPKIAKPSGTPPTTLIKKDLVVGKGPAVQAGQTATVQYVGASWSNGQVFDASWTRNQPFPFPVGQQQVIPGWDQGVPGMRVGGRRELVIPPELGYGAQGSPPAIGPNETLVFVIDLKRIG